MDGSSSHGTWSTWHKRSASEKARCLRLGRVFAETGKLQSDAMSSGAPAASSGEWDGEEGAEEVEKPPHPCPLGWADMTKREQHNFHEQLVHNKWQARHRGILREAHEQRQEQEQEQQARPTRPSTPEEFVVEIVSPDAPVFDIPIAVNATIGSLKEKIQTLVDFPMGQIMLYFNQRQLLNDSINDGLTLQQCNVKHKAKMYLLREAAAQILVVLLTGQTITTELRLSESVYDLKIQIEAKCLVPPCHQHCVFSSVVLQNEGVLSGYGITAGSTVYMTGVLGGGMDVVASPKRRGKGKKTLLKDWVCKCVCGVRCVLFYYCRQWLVLQFVGLLVCSVSALVSSLVGR